LRELFKYLVVSAIECAEANVIQTQPTGGKVDDAISHRTHPSIYNDPMSYRLGKREQRDYATYDEWLGMNIFRVKLGAWIADVPTILLDAVRGEMFSADPQAPTRFAATWAPTAADQREGLLARLLTTSGQINSGTSVWFVGATGLACCADETTFVPAGAG
jgi:hypothetical protein